jgi:hyperosmotically inducible protein
MTLKKAGRSLAVMAALSFTLVSCGPKDAEIKTGVEEKLKNTPGVTVDVKDGVATLNGTFADEAAKTAAETEVKSVKGVKSVVNNATVVETAPVMVSADQTLSTAVAAVVSAYPGLIANVQDGVLTLSGEVKKSDLPKIMQALNALRPKKIENKAAIK